MRRILIALAAAFWLPLAAAAQIATTGAGAVGGVLVPQPTVRHDFTLGSLPGDFTLTRASQASYTTSGGALALASNNTARFDYDAAFGSAACLRIEEGTTNLLTNSVLAGTNLSTQTVTVAATAHTLSFYGTGQIVLSGTSTGTITGTGAYPSRRTYSFTPTAGSLTLTVTGTVQWAQLEAKSYATSWFPTAGAAATRSADVVTFSGASATTLSGASGSFIVETAGLSRKTADNAVLLGADAGVVLRLYVGTSSAVGSAVAASYNGTSALSGSTKPDYTATMRAGLGWAAGARSVSANGETPASDANAVGTATTWYLGSYAGASNFAAGCIRKLKIYNSTLTAAQLSAATTVGRPF